MSNVLSKEKRQQILALGRLGWSLRRIEEATGVRRETASGYLKAAGLTVRGRGRPRARPANPAISSEVSTDSSPATTAGNGTDDTASVPAQRPSRAPQASACEPYRELIVDALGRGRNATAIWQDLVDDHGFPAGYASVRRFVSTVRQQPAVEARAVIATAPGEEAQVDYGEGPMVRDPDTGKYRRTRLFVLTLGYSRKAVRLLVHRSSAQVWAELHERAFRRLGGTVRVVVLDNLKEGVLTPDIYAPTLNPLYRDVLAHYGVVALPCRVRDPDRKGKVEASVGHTQKTPLRGLRFEHLDSGQAYLDRWERRWADTRIHGTTKRAEAPPAVPARWSAGRKTEVVLRLLRGEPVDMVARETQVPAHELEAWRRVFLTTGTHGLKKQGDPEAREVRRLQAKLGEVMMRLELAEDLLEKRGYGDEWRRHGR